MITTNDVNSELMTFLAATAPPGVRVLFAAPDDIFTRECRGIFKLILADPLVLMAGDGQRTWVVLPPSPQGAGLMLTFCAKGHGDVTVLPTLIATNLSEQTSWRAADYDVQATIDAWESLLFRRVMVAERVS